MDNVKKQDIINTIRSLISEYGSQEIKASKVMLDLGKPSKELLVTYGKLVSAGVYSLEDFDEDDIVVNESNVESVVAIEDNTENSKITDYFYNECLIPPINDYYVEFGCYAPVLRIVKSNSFLPFFIQGESGNGKCFFYDQKVKVRVNGNIVDIEIGELFKKLGLDNADYNTNLYSEIGIQVQTPTNDWVDVTSFVKKPKLPMIKILLENNVILKVAEQHIFQTLGKDVFAIDATCIDTSDGPIKIISKEYFGNYDAYDISIPSPHLYYDSNGIIHHNTEGVEQACAVAKRELVCCNVTNETTEEDLMGSFILSNGNMIWKDGPVLVAMRRGAVLLIDESDQFGTSCMALQSVLQCKPYYVKKTNEMVYPKKGFTIIATANTKGDGDAGDRFVGANVLNEAFLERFNCVFEQQYPPAKVEMKILSKLCDDNVFLVNIVRWASSIRENYRLGTISRCITTRRLVQIVKNFQVFGSQKTAIQYGINRFDTDTRDAMMDYYENINSITYTDGLDEYLPKSTIEDATTNAWQTAAFVKKPKMNADEFNANYKAASDSGDFIIDSLKTAAGMYNASSTSTDDQQARIAHLKKIYGKYLLKDK